MIPSYPDLFVAWQDTVDRGIYPVARLRVEHAEPRIYEFRYIRGALEAQARGFIAFDSFPQLSQIYRGDELFPFFKNRVMPPSRPDYAGYVTELGLSVETADPLTLLARSGGVRATDRIEIYAAASDDASACDWHFLLRGIRHLPSSAEDRIASLTPGETLYVMRDVQNDSNAEALLVRSADKVNLGYIPDLLIDGLTNLDLSLDNFKITVEQVNPPPSPVRHRVLCHLQLRAVNGVNGSKPFMSERFTPI